MIAKFVWEDISRCRDPDKKTLKYMVGIDRSRARMHGRFKLSVLDNTISIYAKRNFHRSDSSFLIKFQDIICHQAYQKQQICLRDLVISKNPLQQFETLFVKLPIIEIKQVVKFNDENTVNHFFNQQNVKTLADWIERVKDFMAKTREVVVHLNIPSVGNINETQKSQTYLPLLLQDYS